MAFASLPPSERSAFFSLLDEYFDSRPHLLPTPSAVAAPPAAAGAAATSTSSSSSAQGPPGSITLTKQDLNKAGQIGRAVWQGTRTAQQPATTANDANPNTASIAPSGTAGRIGTMAPRIPAGLTSNKAIGKLSTTSAGVALGSIFGGGGGGGGGTGTANAAAPAPASVAPAVAPRSGPPPPPPQRTGARATPSATKTTQPEPEPEPIAGRAQAGEGEEEEGEPPGLGWGEALYDFAATDVADLAVTRGEQVYLLRTMPGDDWYEARSADGSRQGIVPCNYVRRS